MMHRSIALALPLFVLSAGCAQSTWYGKEFMPAGQVRTVLQSDATSDPKTGHIDSSWAAVSGRETAKAANGGYALTWDGIANGQLCVTTEGKGYYKLADKDGEKREVSFARNRFGADALFFEAKKTLDDITDGTEWPKAHMNSVADVDVKVVSSKLSDHVMGTTAFEPGYKLVFRITECGAAPAIGPDTRYVTITRYDDEVGIAPSLFVWVIDRDPNLAPASAPPATDAPKSSTTDPAPTEKPPAIPAGSGDVVATANAAGCTIFAKALVDSGVAETLKTGGPYTVLAPSDEAFTHLPKGTWEGLQKEPAKLKTIVSYHVIAGSLKQADLEKELEKQERVHVLTTLEGSRIRLDKSFGEIKLGRGKIKTADLAATNGVVHVVDQVSTPR